MREYGQIQCAIWGHPDFRRLNDGAKLLFCFLLTSKHSNGLGCYQLPMEYICADMRIDLEELTESFQSLSSSGFVKYCDKTEYIYIPKFLKWNRLSNKNTAKAREKEFRQIPSSVPFLSLISNDCLAYGAHFSNEFLSLLEGFRSGSLPQSETLSKGFRNPCKTVVGKGFQPPPETLSNTQPNPTQPNPTQPLRPTQGEDSLGERAK